MSGRVQKLCRRNHDRGNFDCGEETLNNYLKQQASQDQRRYFAICHVLPDDNGKTIKGYYTLCATAVPVNEMPAELNVRKIYELCPAALLGRLAVALRFQNSGLGGRLLMHAIETVISINQKIGIKILILHPLDDLVKEFYKKYGFECLDDKKMFLRIDSATKTLPSFLNVVN